MSTEDEFPTQLTDLNDSCICAVFGWLSAPELARVSLVCSAFKQHTRANPLWLKLIQRDFGLNIAADGHAEPVAAATLYQLLRRGNLVSAALNCCAVATDGGCDEPDRGVFWADNLFTYSTGEQYCSAASTHNIHVFGRLVPGAGAGDAQRTPRQQQEQQEQQLQEDPAVLREYLLQRCQGLAVGLMSPETVTSILAAVVLDTQHNGQQQDGTAAGSSSASAVSTQAASAAGGPGVGPGLVGLLRRLSSRVRGQLAADVGQAGCEPSLEQLELAAATALNSCSTEGLSDLFMFAYVAQQRGQEWAQPLFRGLSSDQDIHTVHATMFRLWETRMRGRGRSPSNFMSVPLPPAPAVPYAAAPATNQSPQQGPQQQQRLPPPPQQQQQRPGRELMCDKQQLLALHKGSLSGNTCLVHEVIISRGRNHVSTCPIASGFIYMGMQQQQQVCAAHASGSIAAAACGGGHGSRQAAADVDADASDSTANALAQMTCQPLVVAGNGVTSAAAVLAAAEAGLLPPVLDYARNEAGEYIEFAPPSEQQMQQQGQQNRTTSAGCSSLDGVVMVPVLWFRFHPRRQGQQADEVLDMLGPGFEDLQDEFDDEAAEVAENLEEPQQLLHGQQQQPPQQQPGAEMPNLAAMAVFNAIMAVQPGLALGPIEDDAAGVPEAAPAQAEGDAADQQQQRQVDTATAGRDANAAATMPEPRSVASNPVCAKCPKLPVAATEVGAALGWLPNQHQRHLLAVRLMRPRVAQLVCAKLLDSEDCKPAFNAERGGCNIDCEMVMCRGQHMHSLPAGLHVLGSAYLS